MRTIICFGVLVLFGVTMAYSDEEVEDIPSFMWWWFTTGLVMSVIQDIKEIIS